MASMSNLYRSPSRGTSQPGNQPLPNSPSHYDCLPFQIQTNLFSFPKIYFFKLNSSSLSKASKFCETTSSREKNLHSAVRAHTHSHLNGSLFGYWVNTQQLSWVSRCCYCCCYTHTRMDRWLFRAFRECIGAPAAKMGFERKSHI